MKALWLQWAARIDALAPRERAMACVAAVAVVIFIAYMGFIEPSGARERTLRAAIQQQKAQLAGIDVEIAQKQAAAQADPDADLRKRLAAVQSENGQLRASLRTTQTALVAPERMSVLLQQMVQQNGKLKLLSLRTLAPAGTTDGNFGTDSEGAAGAPAAPALPRTALSTTPPGAPVVDAIASELGIGKPDKPLLYRHGVRIVLQGAYGDMVAYMAALERLPSRLYWDKATLDATEHDKATLTLTLFTLSLDQQWIAL
ncbi:type II secretion system protein GspM [Pseudoduganella umbonata]|uniref:MSHA biogenesis protein MshJ n=1 Tax=Pseudoduganella umbonata TaxID=864828 RepID=A0A4P8HMR8_9BURK|nr:type II secretion system protein GspM [Pseudoduganella umbonata]MBB3219666.1 MSHA biogenesis protein MshJ [Pseudoduganella umbonata]QCP09724.1 type II secretion system protein M [Pseudoduganella umbonata]